MIFYGSSQWDEVYVNDPANGFNISISDLCKRGGYAITGYPGRPFLFRNLYCVMCHDLDVEKATCYDGRSNIPFINFGLRVLLDTSFQSLLADDGVGVLLNEEHNCTGEMYTYDPIYVSIQG